MNNSSQVKTANLILNSQYYNLGTLSNSNNNSSFIGNYSQKFDSININNTQNDNSKIKSKKHQNLRYNVYYNKICGLEAYPIKLKEVEKEKEKEREKDYKINKKIKSFKDNNKKYNSQGYMNMVEKYIDLEMIKKKARRDAELLLKEREKNYNKNLNKATSGKSPRYNGNKVINKKKNFSKNKNNNKDKAKNKNNIDYLIEKYDLDNDV